MACHGGTQKFNDVPSHIALSDKMRADEVSCSSCHGPAHPTPAERENVPDRHPDVFSQELMEISADDLAKLMEKFNE